VIYYADEKGPEKKPNHPLADIFFRTHKGELVLIDVAGSAEAKEVKKKGTALANWISKHQKRFADATPPSTLHGVVLALGIEGPSILKDNVQVVRGKDARLLLGGLRQVFRWLSQWFGVPTQES
jgi:hypothetical protein